MAHSYAERVDVGCPRCGEQYQADVWLIVDIQERTDFVQLLSEGTLNQSVCPHCGDVATWAAPLLIYQGGGPSPQILFSPAEGSTSGQNQQHLTNLFDLLRSRLGPEHAQTALDQIRFVPRKDLIVGGDLTVAQYGQTESQQVQRCRLRLSAVSREHDPARWAQLQMQLGDSYLASPTGRRAENIEVAIGAYRKALDVLSQELEPQGWAVALNQLGLAYLDRIAGSRTENMEQAVAAFNQAALVLTREQAPEAWATLTMNVANAYAQAVGSDRAERVEQAISLYHQVLEVRTREGDPLAWAQATYNLATCYQNRICGSREDNLDRAIVLYQALAEIRTRENAPDHWATTQMALGNALSYRVSGNRAENLERAIQAYDDALEIITRDRVPYQWADIQMNRGLVHARRISGDQVANIEQAILAMEGALAVLTGQATAENMATLLTNLASAYLRRPQERAHNIEHALAMCQQALRLLSLEQLPFAWAHTMEMLADVYAQRIVGEREDNIERAIGAREEVLRKLQRDKSPRDYAENLLGLSTLYRKRLCGDRADNIEKAIDACQQALHAFEMAGGSRTSTEGLQTLANAYLDRMLGDRAENIEQAIQLLERVLDAHIRSGDRLGQAGVAVSLGTAYAHRVRGNKAENIKRAIGLYEEVRKVRTRETFPVEWAATTHGLALAYMGLGQIENGEAPVHIERAIAFHREALEIRTRETMPYEWAQTMHNLAHAYTARVCGERVANMASAMTAAQEALEVLRAESFPMDCLVAARTLGDLHFNEQQWSNAAAAYNTALDASARLYKASLFRRSRDAELGARRNLHHVAGFSLAKLGRLEEAVTIVEQGRALWLDEALARDSAELESIKDVAPEAYAQYREAAACIEQLEATERSGVPDAEEATTGPPILREEAARAQQTLDAAIQQMAKSIPRAGNDKNWVMIEIESMKELNPPAYAEYVAAEARLRQIEKARRITRTGAGEASSMPLTLREDLARAWRALNGAVEAMRSIPGHEGFLAKPDFRQIARSVRPASALVYLMTLSPSSLAMVLIPDAAAEVQVHAVWADGLTTATLDALLISREEKNSFVGYLSALDASSITPQFLETALSKVLPFLGKHLMAPVAGCLRDHGASCATLLPSGSLHLLPLHAATYVVEGQERCFLDEFDVSYAPSIRALNTAQATTEALAQRKPSLIGVANPLPHSQPLPFAHVELDKVAARFPETDQHKLFEEQATVDAFLQRLGGTHVHLACHGSFRPFQPLESQLQFAGEVPLTLQQILDENRFRGVRLVTLSACETGISAVGNLSDEALGMPAGLLRAGAAGVVGTLWAINDLSTMLLMECFYGELLAARSPPRALRRAQLWLRDLRAGELARRFDAERHALGIEYEQASAAWRRFAAMPPDHHPFAPPYYWAAFTFTGA